MFDKTLYWDNRRAGRRGQGERSRAKITVNFGMTLKLVAGKLMMVNRATARRKIPNNPRHTKHASPRLVRRDLIDAQKAAEALKARKAEAAA